MRGTELKETIMEERYQILETSEGDMGEKTIYGKELVRKIPKQYISKGNNGIKK